MLWGKYWKLIDDERMRCRESQCADGGDLLVVVSLQLGSQCKFCRPLSLVCLQSSLLVIADWCRAQIRDLVWTDHA
jgi:hypothetical protein